MLALNLFTGSEEKNFSTFFPPGSYVKTMSTDGGHVGWRSGPANIILKVHYPRTIHARFAVNLLTSFRGEKYIFVEVHPCNACFKSVYWFRGEKFLNIFPPGSYVKTVSADGGHLEFSIATKNIIFVEVHPITTQCNKSIQLAQCFLTRTLNVNQIEKNYLPLAAMLNFRSTQKTYLCRSPSTQHPYQFH